MPQEKETHESLPRWSLDAIFPGFDSAEYAEAKEELASLCRRIDAELIAVPNEGLAGWLLSIIKDRDRAGALGETLSAYVYARYSTDTRDARALAEVNAIEEALLPSKRATVIFRKVLAEKSSEIKELLSSNEGLKPYAFHLSEQIFLESRQMSPEMEDLAEDLSRSGGDAWGRLQEAVMSNASVLWDTGSGERKTIVQLRLFAFDPDRAVREKAFRKELEKWKEVEIPLAAALNGVKGFAVTLNERRHWSGALEKSIFQARISEKTLESLLCSMEASLPFFRRYLKAKAKLLGLPRCAFFDLFAPVGEDSRSFSFVEARDLILERFSSFSEEFGAFASTAFKDAWIDAEPRAGKVGGAYCTDFPIRGVSRVLCNYAGSFGAVKTLAHELGHAYHHNIIKDLPYALTGYPMTLAETASIFAETIVFQSLISTSSLGERLTLLEHNLQDGCQIIVDILSRFYFERSVFDRRKTGELSGEELCSLMLDAQKRTYGDGLDESGLHPYMWAAKSHYYSPSLSFYNFPYAFGLLFSLGLYARYMEEGAAFANSYKSILLETGRAEARDVTMKAGCDIEALSFWMKGIAVFEGQVTEFESMAERA